MTITYTYDQPAENETIVMVTFTQGDIVHERPVNAVFTDGSYDTDATEKRVSEVSQGVAYKIAAGVITEDSGVPAPTTPG